MRLIIVGGGGFGHEVREWAQDRFGREQEIHFVDDVIQHKLCSIKDYPKMYEITDRVFMGIGDPQSKKALTLQLKRDIPGLGFSRLIHPTCIVAGSALLGEGVIMCPYSIVSARAFVGDMVSVNIHSSVGHDVRVGEYSTICSHVDLCGHVHLGRKSFIGSCASVLPKIELADGVSVAAGIVVRRSISKENTMVFNKSQLLNEVN